MADDNKQALPVAENVLNREFFPQAPNQAWGNNDIAYLWTQEVCIYLAVLIDLYSRGGLGWSMDQSIKMSAGDPGLDNGNQPQKAATRPDALLGTW